MLRRWLDTRIVSASYGSKGKRGKLTSQVFRRFFNKWNQDKAHECVFHTMMVDYIIDLFHWDRADKVNTTLGERYLQSSGNSKESYLGIQHVARHKLTQ